MGNMLNGFLNLLDFINDNWGMIAAVTTLIIAITKKVKSYLNKSMAEKIVIAKVQISETMLKWVSVAERDWREWEKAGGIKRGQVIDLIFEKYPILSKVTNQAEIINWLDSVIDEALESMREIFEKNANAG